MSGNSAQAGNYSPEKKRQEKIDEEVREAEELMKDVKDMDSLMKIAKNQLRALARRRILQEEENETKREEVVRRLQKVEDEKSHVEEKVREANRVIAANEWPNKVRSTIFDIEDDLNMSSLIVCYQCGFVHEPLCQQDKNRRFPNEMKAQCEFIRRQRWIHAIFYNTEDIRIQKIRSALETKFQEIHSRTSPENMNDAEKFIWSLNTVENLIFWFAQAIATIFSSLSDKAKAVVTTRRVQNMGVFTPPYDLLATILVNSAIVFDESGEVTLEPSADLNELAVDLVPKKI